MGKEFSEVGDPDSVGLWGKLGRGWNAESQKSPKAKDFHMLYDITAGGYPHDHLMICIEFL